ncbi:MAG: hypothetical protein VB021_04920 [Oscillospiraceae bacterium]|nr:hypothetical protein [Oscillospiraceae bacterium]
MSRLLKKSIRFLAPLLAVLVLFFVFEPYDYYGLHGEAAYGTRPLSSMRALLRGQPTAIVLGDSRMANLSEAYIREVTGENYCSLAFGGASLGECVELFWYAAAHTKLDKVVFGINFYNAGGVQDSGRIPAVERQAGSAWAFVSHFNYWLEAFNTLKYKTQNALGTALGRQDWLWYPEDPTSFATAEVPSARGAVYRRDLEDYARLIRSMTGEGYSIDDSTYRQLEAVIDYCDAAGIELTIVLPPMHESIFTDVVRPLGIAGELEKLRTFLTARAVVFDFEYPNAFTANEDNFYDGFHLQGPQKQLLIDVIFGNASFDCVRISRPTT